MTLAKVLPVAEVAACCHPLTHAPVSDEGAVALAGALRALADPARIRLLSIIAATENGEACVCDLTEPLGLQQSTVSHHLKILVDAGFVARDKRGTWSFYRLVPGSLAQVAGLLAEVER
ncbi:MAG: metalloregulator ArsR/SmtB family transcription factor [Actinomycetes bacterium]|nr:MAG: transcriptional regulator [Actinomycetota bacterium]